MRFPFVRIIALTLPLWLPAESGAQVQVQGSIRTRVEGWNWFDAPPAEGSYAFSGSLLRLSMSERRQTWDWQVELAAPLLLDLPESAIAPAPALQLGFGGNYFAANHRERNAAMVFPKQAFARFRDLLAKGDSLRLGRFEFIDGAETTPKNPTLAALKRDRIAHRLIGNFGFSHIGRSLDGAQYSWTGGGLNVTLVGAVPTRGVFQVDGWGNLPIAVAYGAVTGAQAGSGRDSEWRVFGLYYDDTRTVVKTDNRPAALRALDAGQNVRIGTFGGHFLHEARTAAGSFDALFWGAGQTGKWASQDHRGWAFAAEGGWQPKGFVKLRPWLRAGYFHSSGDDNPLDGTHGTFFNVLPTPRIYARIPFFNLMNLRDLSASLILRPHKTVTLRTDLRSLHLASGADSWYQGGGAFQPWTFGYVARPSGGRTGLATLWDLSADWQASAHLQLSGYLSHVAGGDVVRAVYPAGRNANLAYVEATWRF